MKAMRRKAAAKGFNVRLFDNIIVAATLAGFISYLICKTRRAARIGWFSDRDSITAAHEAFAHHLYAARVPKIVKPYPPQARAPAAAQRRK
jgi:hypothetical protein